jgi:prepilin-type N-terminal cleavage/methylation domain-containing protein
MMPWRIMRKSNRGFTLIEVAVATSLMVVATSVGIVQLKNSVAAADANTAGITVATQLRYAREIAANQRRNVSIEFNDPGTIVISRHEVDGTLTAVATTTLPSGFSFGLPAADVGDTPDGYGADTPVDFNGDSGGTFGADGTFVNDSGVVLSGTVFTIGATDGSARAIALSGANGRTKQYYIRDGEWIEKN